jgi:hypothetical protein
MQAMETRKFQEALILEICSAIGLMYAPTSEHSMQFLHP